MLFNFVRGQLLHPDRWIRFGLNSTTTSASTSFIFAPRRSLSTAQSQPDASPNANPNITSEPTRSYPFSSTVITTPTIIEYDKKLGLMGNVEKKLISHNSNRIFEKYFKKNHQESVRPLSIIKVETYTTSTRTTTTTTKTNTNNFTGILMGIRRRGTETSFRLRNILEKIGVEIKFNLYSPIIKNITIIKRAGQLSSSSTSINSNNNNGNGRKALIKKPRRAKLFYLRDHPNKMPDIKKISKAVFLADQQNKLE